MSGLEGADLQRLRSLDGSKWRRDGEPVLSAWVADMDFASPPCALDAMRAVLDRSDIGYNLRAVRELPDAFADWQEQAHGWRPDLDRVQLFNDVLHVLEYAIWHLTEPGDGIVLITPIYPPFIKLVEGSGRRIIDCPLDAAGRFDADVLASVVDETTAAVLWCNPHNPTGRAFDDDELAAFAAVVVDHDLLVLSDEVWADLVHPGAVHRPAALVPGLAEHTITVSSASKSFNLAGLRCAVAHVGDEQAWQTFDRLPVRLRGHVNTLGAEATLACWRDGSAWLDQLRHHLVAQFDHLSARLESELPGVEWRRPDATYLAWLDGRGLGLGVEFADEVRRRCDVALSPGPDFGPLGAGHARLNVATSREILDEILDRMIGGLAR